MSANKVAIHIVQGICYKDVFNLKDLTAKLGTSFLK